MTYYMNWKLSRDVRARLRALGDTETPMLVVQRSPVTPVSPQHDLKPQGDGRLCRCGIAAAYVGGDPRHFMAYACPRCHSCVRNCECPGASPLPRPLQLTALPAGIWWHVWNYGLFGDETASDIPGVCFHAREQYVLAVPSFAALSQVIQTYTVVELSWRPRAVEGGMIGGSLQLPEVSSHTQDTSAMHRHLVQDTALAQHVATWYRSLEERGERREAHRGCHRDGMGRIPMPAVEVSEPRLACDKDKRRSTWKPSFTGSMSKTGF